MKQNSVRKMFKKLLYKINAHFTILKECLHKENNIRDKSNLYPSVEYLEKGNLIRHSNHSHSVQRKYYKV